MARRTRGSVYRKSRNGKRAGFYRARYTDADGKVRDHVIVLPNGAKTTDRDCANAQFDRILRQVDRRAAGLVDMAVESAQLPMVGLVARYVRRKRRG